MLRSLAFLAGLGSLMGFDRASSCTTRVVPANPPLPRSLSKTWPWPYGGRKTLRQLANEAKQEEGRRGFRTRQKKLALWSARCQAINKERHDALLFALGLIPKP